MSAFCLAARSLGKAAAIAAVLILDHQRATGGLWVDNVAPAPGQKPETGKARRLLEAFNRHHGGRAPRARDVETAARGLVSLASAGLLRGRLWALSPELALYGRYLVSRRLKEEGFEFRFPSLPEALADLCTMH